MIYSKLLNSPIEVEEGEWLPFLDVKVIRSNGTLKKKLFRKKTYAGIILIRSLGLTDADFWDEKLDKLTRIFLGNGYPNEVIQRNIRAMKSRWQNGDYDKSKDD
ncbi:unnamed protein product [Protopolystoma xenopodis]|uniref:Helix-turn-helix domain-containing protein n=1 Tax=Protopolystoma xenopodis TaxID=117903 RepID=A0A3S5ANC4_9PLAT|nr:unnamed protein product [Protopolystoma xenopodis]